MPGVSCTQCNERFYWTELYGEKVCPKCKLVQFYAEREIGQSAQVEYRAPECKWDFPAAYRDQILTEVKLNGEIHWSTVDIANAFHGWDDGQIDGWCVEHNLVMIADFRTKKIVIRPVRVSFRV